MSIPNELPKKNTTKDNSSDKGLQPSTGTENVDTGDATSANEAPPTTKSASSQQLARETTHPAERKRNSPRPSYNDPNSRIYIDHHRLPEPTDEEVNARLDEFEAAAAAINSLLPKAAAEFGMEKLVRVLLDTCTAHRCNTANEDNPNSARLVKELETAVKEQGLHQSIPFPQRLPDGKKCHNKQPLSVAKMGIGLIPQLIFQANDTATTQERLSPAAIVKYMSALFDLRHDSEMYGIVRNAAQSIRNAMHPQDASQTHGGEPDEHEKNAE